MQNKIETLIKPLNPYLKDPKIQEIFSDGSDSIALMDNDDKWNKVNSVNLQQNYWKELCYALAKKDQTSLSDPNNFRLTSSINNLYKIDAIILNDRVSVCIKRDESLISYLPESTRNKIRAAKNLLVLGDTGEGKTRFVNEALKFTKNILTIGFIESYIPELQAPKDKIVRRANIINRGDYQSEKEELDLTIDMHIRQKTDIVVFDEINSFNLHAYIRLLNIKGDNVWGILNFKYRSKLSNAFESLNHHGMNDENFDVKNHIIRHIDTVHYL